MIITAFSQTHNFVFTSIVVRLSDTAVSDPVQQLVVCSCGPRRWAVVWSWPDDWQVQLLARVLQTRGGFSSRTNGTGGGIKLRDPTSGVEEGGGGGTCPQLNSTILTGLWRNKSATSLSQWCYDCSSFRVFLSAPPPAFFRHRTSSHLMSHQLLRGSTSCSRGDSQCVRVWRLFKHPWFMKGKRPVFLSSCSLNIQNTRLDCSMKEDCAWLRLSRKPAPVQRGVWWVLSPKRSEYRRWLHLTWNRD